MGFSRGSLTLPRMNAHRLVIIAAALTVAVAAALATALITFSGLAGSPQVLLADEPTGQLDSETAKQIMRLLRTVVQSEGVTALVATHDPNLIDIADSVLDLEDGTIKDD